LLHAGARIRRSPSPKSGISRRRHVRLQRQATTSEDLGPYPTQDVANTPKRVKDHSELDLRIDPANVKHLIGQSKWAVSAEGYNHLLGFYESFDGGKTLGCSRSRAEL
jgi:hypothetical protein